MILLAFGALVIASLFILAGWFRSGWQQRFPATVYNAALCMALGMDLTAIGFTLMLSGRIEQILFEGLDLSLESPIYWTGIVAVMAGKSFFVWVAALGKGRDYSKPFWWSYWATLAAWVVFCIWWYL